MKNTPNKFNRFLYALMPLAFVGNGFLNIVFFVFGQDQHDLLRKLFTFGIQGVVALLLLVKIFFLWRSQVAFRKPLAMASAIPLLLGVLYGVGLFGARDLLPFSKNAIVSMCNLLSLCCVTMIVILENQIEDFLRRCKWYALIISPAILFYCIRFYFPMTTGDVRYLGALDYMTLAYTLLVFVIFLLFDSFQVNRKSGHFVNIILMFLFCAAITLSGTKGAIVCLLFFAVLAAVYAVVCKASKKLLIPVSTAIVCIVCLFAFVFPGFGGESRIISLIKESGKVEVTDEDVSTIETTKKILLAKGEQGNAGNPGQATHPSMTDIVAAVNNGDAERALQNGDISEEEYNQLLSLTRKLCNTETGARKYLWDCAVDEIKTAPWTGQGTMFYQNKYGTYPHNIFLELATDYGIPITLLIVLVGIYVFIKIIYYSYHMRNVALFTIYVLTFLPQKMVSGSVYSSDVFFQYGFCILIVIWLRQNKKKLEKEEILSEETIPGITK